MSTELWSQNFVTFSSILKGTMYLTQAMSSTFGLCQCESGAIYIQVEQSFYFQLNATFSPRQLWVRGMMTQMSSSCTVVQDVVNLVHYGIDEDGPVPEQQLNYQTVVPQSPININRRAVGAS